MVENSFEEINWPPYCKQECPKVPKILGMLEELNDISNAALQQGLSPTEHFDMPPQVYEIVGSLLGREVDPLNEDEKNEFVKILREQAGSIYEGVGKFLELVNSSTEDMLDSCGNRGPIKMEVREAGAAFVLKVCRADVVDHKCEHEHTIHATLSPTRPTHTPDPTLAQ